MADIVFNTATGRLQAFGRTWNAISGGGRYAALPKKAYTCPPGSLMVGTECVAGAYTHSRYAKTSYVDGRGLGWFLWLGEGNLGLHPDGKPRGTAGCIGVIDPDTRPLFNDLRSKSSRAITVEVL